MYQLENLYCKLSKNNYQRDCPSFDILIVCIPTWTGYSGVAQGKMYLDKNNLAVYIIRHWFLISPDQGYCNYRNIKNYNKFAICLFIDFVTLLIFVT